MSDRQQDESDGEGGGLARAGSAGESSRAGAVRAILVLQYYFGLRRADLSAGELLIIPTLHRNSSSV